MGKPRGRLITPRVRVPARGQSSHKAAWRARSAGCFRARRMPCARRRRGCRLLHRARVKVRGTSRAGMRRSVRVGILMLLAGMEAARLALAVPRDGVAHRTGRPRAWAPTSTPSAGNLATGTTTTRSRRASTSIIRRRARPRRLAFPRRPRRPRRCPRAAEARER